jgi:ketosteroid isomerase-like protein
MRSGTTLPCAIALLSATTAVAAPPEDAKIIAALDTQYQLAVKVNDAATMDRILHDKFTLVLGSGAVYSKADLLDDAKTKRIAYEQQDEDPGTQTVRVWGDTAVVTARLRLKGKSPEGAFERTLWFSDTYIRTPNGWRYVFGQASLPLPPAPQTPKKAAAR